MSDKTGSPAGSLNGVALLETRGIILGAIERLRKGALHLLGFSRKYPVGAASGFVLVLVGIIAAAAPLVAPHDPLQPDFTSLQASPSIEHLLGTDHIGRDALSRIIFGSRMSLLVAFASVLLGDSLGAAWGVASGYIGGKFDLIGQRFLELLMAFPTLILAVALVVGLGAGVHTVVIAIAITRIPLAVRVIRSVALSVKENAYVDAARAIGASETRIMTRHIFPQCVAPILVLVTTHLGAVIVLEASLSFLGVGIPPPTPSWGTMLGGAVSATLIPIWWLVVFPGVAITITVLAFNLFGDSLRDALDPKLRD